MLLAVSPSGGSDSTGAIAGNLLGGVRGDREPTISTWRPHGGIPAQVVNDLEFHEVLETLCRDWNALFVLDLLPISNRTRRGSSGIRAGEPQDHGIRRVSASAMAFGFDSAPAVVVRRCAASTLDSRFGEHFASAAIARLDMRILGLYLQGQSGPVGTAFLECGDITVLVGPNDTGKSRVLGAIEAALNDDIRHFSASVTVYAAADRVELMDYEAGPDESVAERSVPMPEAAVANALRDQLRWDRVGGEEPVAFVLPTEGLPLAGWIYGAPWARLSEVDRQQLAAAGLEPPSVDAVGASVPVPISLAGAFDLRLAPLPVPLPAPMPDVIAEVSRSIVALCRALRLLPSRWSDIDPAVDDLSEGVLVKEELPDWAYEEHPEWAASSRWLLVEQPGAA